VSGVSHGVTKADERRTVRGGDGAEGDGDGAGFEEAAGVGADGLAEVSLQVGEREEAAVRLDLHLPGDTAGCCCCRFGLRRHLAARGGRRGVSDSAVLCWPGQMGQHVAPEIWPGPSTARPREPWAVPGMTRANGLCLGPSLQPVGWHGLTREADSPLWHDGRHDLLVARLIKGTTHPA
jgi:hypothetical protein